MQDEFPLYKKLPADLKKKLQADIHIFISEKVFVGRDDFVVTDRARLLIAAQACLLILNKPGDYYPGFETILIYPETYLAKVTKSDGLIQSETLDSRAGESWHRGPVILAWDQVLQGARDDRDGYNVVLHEFAHKLDEENNYMDGLPILSSREHYSTWASVLSREYEKLCQHGDEVIDGYGANSAAEFFAVVTEAFFEKPEALKNRHPELYQQFQQYFQLDPVEWFEE